jgi:hypothetical protein
MTEQANHPKTYFFFVGSDRYETDLETVTGAYVKSRISNLPAGAGLQLDGQGNDADLPFGDNDSVSLEIGHGHGGPRRFTVVPPATFG